MSQLISPLKYMRIRNIIFNKAQASQYFALRGRYFSSKGDGDQNPKDTSKVVSDSSSAEKKSNPKSKEALNKDSDKKAKAKKKLFSLLSEFEVESPKGNREASNLNLAKAVKRPTKKERFKDLKIVTPQEKLQEAVRNVAENVSGDPDQTQKELNKRLSSLNLVESENEMEAISEEFTDVDPEMKSNIMSSVEDVASTVTGVKDISSIKSELTQRLMRLAVEDKSTPNKSIELLKGMKVEKKAKEMEDKQDTQINVKERVTPRVPSKPKLNTVNIFQSPPLNIFSLDESKDGEKNTVWNQLEEKNLRLLVQFAPSNGFEEMILWTEQGKHWKFPIDNEAGRGEEENVGFHEHVFLEHHLHGFPTKGPVRQFMELVCVGLSKNPYISVERKVENIDWFRNYFKEKEEILQRYDILG